MTDVNDYIKPNDEQEKERFEWYYDNVYKPQLDAFSNLLKWAIGRMVYLETQNGITNGQVWYLLKSIGGELILDQDKYLEFTKELSEFGPRQTHAYLKEDGKFHIWMEKMEGEKPELESLFGGKVEVVDESSEDIQT